MIVAIISCSVSAVWLSGAPPAWRFAVGSYTIQCSQFSGRTATDRIRACIAELPLEGGTADARGIAGDQAIDGEIFPAVPRPVTLLLGNAKFNVHPQAKGYGIVIPSHTTIIGQGAGKTIFSFADSAGEWSRVLGTVRGARDIVISGLEVDGNKSGNDYRRRQNHGIVLVEADGVTIRHTYIHDTNGDAIMLWGAAGSAHGYSSNVLVTENRIVNTGRAGVSVISGQDSSIIDNTFQNDVEFEQIHFEPDDSSQFAKNILVQGNTIDTPDVIGGISISAQVGAGENVSRNRVINNLLNGGHIYIRRSPYTEISGNVVNQSNGDVILLVMAHDCQVRNNIISGTRLPETRATRWGGGLVVQSGPNETSGAPFPIGNNLIDSNSVTGARGAGIWVLNSSNNYLLGNTVRNTQPDVVGRAYAIVVQGTIENAATGNILQENSALDDQTPPTQQYGFVVEGAGETQLIDNSASGNLHGTILNRITPQSARQR